jgi:hypothetical protein
MVGVKMGRDTGIWKSLQEIYTLTNFAGSLTFPFRGRGTAKRWMRAAQGRENTRPSAQKDCGTPNYGADSPNFAHPSPHMQIFPGRLRKVGKFP